MTDKEKIRNEVERLRSLHQIKYQQLDTDSSMSLVECGKRNLCNELLRFIDSLQEEPVSEEFEEAANNALERMLDKYGLVGTGSCLEMFRLGTEWKKEHLWKPADGDDLPEIDREVIAILDYDFGHYKVVYAHRPNPNGWDGTNIDTGEKEHFEPATYGKGGWNQPYILYWLDARLPYEEK